MKIEAGKFYKLRNGDKMRCYATDGGRDGNTIHGAYLQNGNWVAEVWPADGVYASADSTPYDIISEWVDLPVVDWSKMAAWHKWVAMDGGGEWWVYEEKPARGSTEWFKGGESTPIPAKYAPKWTGDWRQSMVERPTA